MNYGTSFRDGLVIFNVSLGQRLLAERMSVAYIKLVTCSTGAFCVTGATTRPDIVLAPNLSEGSSNGGLFTQVVLTPKPIKPQTVGSSNTPNYHLSISSTYQVWLGPSGLATSSHLDVTQNYSFYQDIAEAKFPSATCEPTASIPDCARFKPEVSYQFHPGSGSTEHVQSIEVVERLHFTPDGLADRGTLLTQDCDAITVFTCVNSLGDATNCGPLAPIDSPICILPPTKPMQNPLVNEIAVGAAYPSEGIADNLHQTSDESVSVPLAKPSTPGCAGCVHIHWRWSSETCFPILGVSCANPAEWGDGAPLLCDTLGQPYPSPYTACNANHKLIVALATYHSEETNGVSNFMSLLQGTNSNDLAQDQSKQGGTKAPEWTQGYEALLQAPGACYDAAYLLSWGQCGAVTWLDETANSSTVPNADSGNLFAFGGWFCADPSCRSNSAQFIDPLSPTYSVGGGGLITSMHPGQQFSMQFARPASVGPVPGDVGFFADLLPAGSSNIHITDPYGLCGSPFVDGSGLSAVKCAMPTSVSCNTWCVTISANAPTTPGTYSNYTRAIWGSSTDPTAAIGGNYRKADTLVVK